MKTEQQEKKNYYLYSLKVSALTEKIRKLQVKFNRENNIREQVPIFFKTKDELMKFISEEIDRNYSNN